MCVTNGAIRMSAFLILGRTDLAGFLSLSTLRLWTTGYEGVLTGVAVLIGWGAPPSQPV